MDQSGWSEAKVKAFNDSKTSGTKWLSDDAYAKTKGLGPVSGSKPPGSVSSYR